MGIALIISAIIAAGTTVVAGVAQNQQAKKANKEGLKLAGIQREDTLAQQKTQEELNREQLAISRKAQEMQDREAKLSREERTEERGYNRLQNAANRYSQFLNEQNALVQNRMAPIIGKGK